MTTIRALVLILIGVAVGSLIRTVHAQTDVVLFQVGQRVTLSYDLEHSSTDCTILEIRGSFVRCEQPKPDAFSRFPPVRDLVPPRHRQERFDPRATVAEISRATANSPPLRSRFAYG